MKIYLKRGLTWLNRGLFLLCIVLLLTWSNGPSTQDEGFRLRTTSSDLAFNFTRWELQALSEKLIFRLLAPQRFMNEATRSRFVLAFLDNVGEAQQLRYEIRETYTNPEVTDPDTATQESQQALAALRDEMAQQGPIAEAILEEQVSVVLNNHGGFGMVAQVLPPVRGTVTPLPYLLIISPRDRIERRYQRELQAGLTAAEQAALESEIEAELPDLSAYVTAIGGLSAYPAMLLESTSIDWLADVMAHEWTHHYFMSSPLGWSYMHSGEARTINETAASLLGEWAGQEVVNRFYRPLLNRGKRLPDPLTQEPPASATDESAPPRFDFRAEMHETRVEVDRLLEAGEVEQAEAYMEERRQYFVEHGYQIRRLNQAYFAFHGAYASQPGAAGANPTGPAVRRLWALSETPREFARRVARTTTLGEVIYLTEQLHAQALK
jgi:hypothetical protein